MSIAGEGHTKDLSEQIKDLVGDLGKVKTKKILQDTSLTERHIDAYNAGYAALRNPIPGNMTRVEKAVSLLHNPRISKWFTGGTELKSQKPIIKNLKSVVKKLTKGKVSDGNMSIEEEKQAKEKYPELYQQYKDLRKELTKIHTEATRVLVPMLGKPSKQGPILADVEIIKKALKKAGILVHNIPDGFVGKIDSTGWKYTSQGMKLNKNPAGNSTNVHMNPNYDPKTDNGYYVRYVPRGSNITQSVYTMKWDGNKSERKTQKVMGDKVLKKVKSARKKWLADMDSKDHNNSRLGLMTELLYRYQPRIGNDRVSMSGDTNTYGLTTWKGKHIKVKNKNRLTIEFLGKSRTPQQYILEKTNKITKKMIKHLKELKKEAGKEGFLFVPASGGKIFSNNKFNEYLSKKGLDLTASSFRLMRGRLIMEKYFQENELPMDAKEVEVSRYLKAGALEVGKALGHMRGVKDGEKRNLTSTYETAIRAYIPFPLMYRLYEERGMRVPKWLTSIHKVASSSPR